MFVAHHFDTHSTTNHPTSPSSDPFPCSLSPAGSVLDGLGFAHPSQSRQLAWPNRVHLRCGLGVSHSVAPDHASRHRPYSVLLVLSRFNNAGLSPALISAPWRTRAPVPWRRGTKGAPGKNKVAPGTPQLQRTAAVRVGGRISPPAVARGAERRCRGDSNRAGTTRLKRTASIALGLAPPS